MYFRQAFIIAYFITIIFSIFFSFISPYFYFHTDKQENQVIMSLFSMLYHDGGSWSILDYYYDK